MDRQDSVNAAERILSKAAVDARAVQFGVCVHMSFSSFIPCFILLDAVLLMDCLFFFLFFFFPLPVHFQFQKDGGFKCRISLAVHDKKTSEVKRREYFDGRIYETDLEAKHFNAVFTLHSICFDKVGGV